MIYDFLHVWSDERLDQLQVHFFSPPRFRRQLLWEWGQNEAEARQHRDRVVCIDHYKGLGGWRKHHSCGSFQGVWLTWLAASGWTPEGYLSVLSRYCSFIKNLSALLCLSFMWFGWFSLYFFFPSEAFYDNARYWSGMNALTEMCADRKHARLAIVVDFSLSLCFFLPSTFPPSLISSARPFRAWSVQDASVIVSGGLGRGHLSCHIRPNLQVAGRKSQGARQK